MTATIERVDLFPVRLPMIKSFTFASGSAGVAGGKAPHLFLKMTDSEGRVAWGEGRPVPAWSYETLETVTMTIRHQLAPAIIGMPITDRRAIQQRMHQAIGRGPSTGQPIAKAAVDIAVHDLCAQAAGMTLRAFLGGQDGRNSVDLSYTLTGHDRPSILDEMAEGAETGFRHFNFKAAVDPATDVEVAETVRERILDGGFVWADANQGCQLHHAWSVARAFERIGVDLLEQPLPADQIHLMRTLRSQTSIPLAVDEASVSPGDFFNYVSQGLVDYLVIKLTRSGGIWPTMQQVAVAHSAGLPLIVSGLTDGFITKVAACQVALSAGCTNPAALNGSQFTDEDALFPQKAANDESASFVERLTWISQTGEVWIDEKRRIDVKVADPSSGMWFLDMTFDLTNLRGEALTFGSPPTAGRPMAGYGGLFWRGPRSFLDGDILASDGQAGPDVMGQPASWLAYTGKHDGVTAGENDSSTLIFVDHPDNLRYPNKWFVRGTPFACASFAFMFDEEYALPPGETLSLRYRIIVADGERDRSEIEALAKTWQSS